MHDIELIRQAVLGAGKAGEPFSRDAIQRAYLGELEREGRCEAVSVSQAWIDLFWDRLRGADPEGLAHKARHADQFAQLVGPILGRL